MPTHAGKLRARSATELRRVESTSPHVLAVDLGTGGPKVAVLAATGRIVAHAFQAVGIDLTDDGGAEQSPQAWWDAIVASARRALADSGVAPADVIGLGCTSQWSGTVPVDDAGSALGPGHHLDGLHGEPAPSARRCAARSTCRAIRRRSWPAGCAGPAASRACRARTRWATSTSCASSAPTSTRRPPSSSSRSTTSTCASPGWPGPRTTPSRLHWVTDNRDISAIAYDDSVMGLAGLERAKLPDLVPTGSVLGGLTPAAAAELGLLPGTPVVAGTGDLHSAAVGSGAVADFAGHLYIGTSSWISCHVPFKKTDPLTNIASIPSGIPGRYLVADEHETGGACLTWLRDNHALPRRRPRRRRQPRTRRHPVHRPRRLLRHAQRRRRIGPRRARTACSSRPGSTESARRSTTTPSAGASTTSRCPPPGPTWCVPSSRGSRSNSAWLLGAVEKYCKRPFGSLAFVGGGANSDLWSQIHADATGRTIRQIDDPVLANVRGAGLLTLLALGHLTIADIPGTVTVKATYEPDPEAGEVYAALLKEFVNLYEKTKGIHKRLNGRRLQQLDDDG